MRVFQTSFVTVALMALIAVGLECQFIPSRAVWAQEESQKSESSTDPDALQKLIDRINKISTDSERLNKDAPPAEQPIMALLEMTHLGLAWGNPQTRYLVLHVMLANNTKRAFTIAQDHVAMEIDGEDRKLKEIPRSVQNQSIPSNRKHVPISTIKPPKEWTLPANGLTGLWLVYPDLPLGSNVPKCKLKIKLDDLTKEIDVNQLERTKLNLDIQRIGPRQSLALITIGGVIDTFNSGALVDELDKLVEQKVARVVIRWGEGATPPDQQLMTWLQVAAVGNGGNPNHNPLFPVIPAAIREFHLTEFPTSDDKQGRNAYPYGLRPTTQPRIHKTSAESVAAALRTAYLALPRDELLNEIKTGHPLTRAAALAFGGGRLDVAELPRIFEWAEDKDPELQKAALQSLSNFGEPQAIAKLIDYAQRNVEPLSSLAIESLAGSRFGAAHDALLQLLKGESDASKKKIVQILAKYPRPIWSDTLFEFVTNSSNGMDADSLKALVQVGHPQLVDVLERALKSTDKPIRDQAFQELAKRSDDRSEALAVDYALTLLESGPPDAAVVQLLSRTKDSRAIPLLLKQLDASNDRTNSINLLLQLGDHAVADRLVQRYTSLNNSEKVQILQGLKPFHHTRFRDLCGEALLTNDNQMVTTAANALTQDGHPEGEKLLVVALDRQKTAHLMGNIMNALANYGTPSARAALIRARDSGDANKKTYATQALANLRQRSPGYQYFFQGYNYHASKQDKEALEAYDLAIQVDPALTEAYWERGKVFLTFQKFGSARKDFEKAIELKYEPLNAEFITSFAIARIGDGQLMEGIKYLEDNRGKQLDSARDEQAKTPKESKGLFLYNSACAYARAIEQVDLKVNLVDRATLREKYRKRAIADLTNSFKQGFDDYDWMAKDPDFKILHDDDDFKKLLARKSSDKSDDSPDGE